MSRREAVRSDGASSNREAPCEGNPSRRSAAEAAPTMLAHLRRRFAANPKLEYLVVKDASLEPLPDDSVDAVFSYGVFVHLHEWDIFSYLREVARVLRPGGRAVIEHSNTLSELGWAT